MRAAVYCIAVQDNGARGRHVLPRLRGGIGRNVPQDIPFVDFKEDTWLDRRAAYYVACNIPCC